MILLNWLKIAPATFQRGMNLMVASMRWQSALVYRDEMVLFASSTQDYIKQVGYVF